MRSSGGGSPCREGETTTNENSTTTREPMNSDSHNNGDVADGNAGGDGDGNAAAHVMTRIMEPTRH
eukprot:1909297-Alexandrium_andersonii.AAC.1